eukprot:scaffold27647_cov36-Cyclotella_meneghiniana.AAC.1
MASSAPSSYQSFLLETKTASSPSRMLGFLERLDGFFFCGLLLLEELSSSSSSSSLSSSSESDPSPS